MLLPHFSQSEAIHDEKLGELLGPKYSRHGAIAFNCLQAVWRAPKGPGMHCGKQNYPLVIDYFCLVSSIWAQASIDRFP
jgi:hypothetical protein